MLVPARVVVLVVLLPIKPPQLPAVPCMLLEVVV